MPPTRDFYATLGVSRTATAEEIQRAYRTLARRHHPDVNKDPEAQERFKDIAEAYDVLSDPETRRRYDAFGADFRKVPDDVDPEEWAAAERRGAARARGRTRARARAATSGRADDGGFFNGDGDGVDLGDLFSQFFGRGASTPLTGADQEVEAAVSLEEAYHGGRRTITVPGPGGRRTIEVTIPAGVTDGQRLRLAGQGGSGAAGGPAGDLYLIVHLAPHGRYRVEGRNVIAELPLAPWEAALGTSLAIDTPGGEVKVRVPVSSSSGRRLRLRGKGLPNPRGTPGDFFAEVRIVLPRTLTEAERHLFQELSATSHFDPRH